MDDHEIRLACLEHALEFSERQLSGSPEWAIGTAISFENYVLGEPSPAGGVGPLAVCAPPSNWGRVGYFDLPLPPLSGWDQFIHYASGKDVTDKQIADYAKRISYRVWLCYKDAQTSL